MYKHKEESKINCLTFQKQEPIVKEIINKINKAQGIQEKVKFAEDLQKETEVLFSCPDCDFESLECKNCHFITNLRKRTTDLIIKAKKLEK